MPSQLTWFGGSGPFIYDTNCAASGSLITTPVKDLVDWPKWGIGSARGFFDKGGSCHNPNWATNENGRLILLTNYLAFSWAKIQYSGSNDWEWGNADQEMAYLTNLNAQIGVCWSWWYPSNSPNSSAYCTNGCTSNAYPCNVSADPPWASTISTTEYALCKGNFINKFVARYSTAMWRHVNAQGITNGLRFVEPENEPDGFTPSHLKMSISILKASQGARTNGVQLIGWCSWSRNGQSLSNFVAYGGTSLVDGISFHFYPYSDDDPSTGSPTPFSSWGEQTNAPLDSWTTNTAVNGYCPDCPNGGRIDSWLNWMHTQIPTNFACYVTEVGIDYEDPGSYPKLPWVPIDPIRMAKYIILLKAGRVTGFNFNGELWYYNNNLASEFPDPPSTLGRAAIWTAYWLQNLPFSGMVSNGNALVYSFGSGSNKVTFAWTYEGTTQSVTVAGYTEAIDLYSNSLDTVSVLSSNITVLLGPGDITFPETGGVGGSSVDAPVAAFSATPTYGATPMIVKFADRSAGTITNRHWQFGDGFVTNTLGPTVVHRYTVPGSNTVQLIVSGPSGASIDAQTNLVIVTPFPLPVNTVDSGGLPPFTGSKNGGTNNMLTVNGAANSSWRFLITY
jgi:PKD repeat protein